MSSLQVHVTSQASGALQTHEVSGWNAQGSRLGTAGELSSSWGVGVSKSRQRGVKPFQGLKLHLNRIPRPGYETDRLWGIEH